MPFHSYSRKLKFPIFLQTDVSIFLKMTQQYDYVNSWTQQIMKRYVIKRPYENFKLRWYHGTSINDTRCVQIWVVLLLAHVDKLINLLSATNLLRFGNKMNQKVSLWFAISISMYRIEEDEHLSTNRRPFSSFSSSLSVLLAKIHVSAYFNSCHTCFLAV